ncbi:aspartate carbamoyltransferase [Actinomycetes bacterium KLBMP 9797]
MNRPDRPGARRALLLVAAMVAAFSGGCADDSPTSDTASRQAEVAQRGASVMPFDLDRTTHRFTKTGSGGVQTVVADDPRDTTQITLIREHLAAEVDRFRRGDFTDPAAIHGDRMPGLEILRQHGGRITIGQETTADGGRVTYTTAVPDLVDALHAWFDAQVSDHGAHATR